MFSVGDFIVEREGARAPASFGVVKGFETAINGEQLLDVQYPTERLYSFASQCQLYREWLDENGF
tara:strand:+ start:434 stop:628 length:195 start_codon:yes stop_codon:yes gene_type:complete